MTKPACRFLVGSYGTCSLGRSWSAVGVSSLKLSPCAHLQQERQPCPQECQSRTQTSFLGATLLDTFSVSRLWCPIATPACRAVLRLPFFRA
ncbi:hypothetical protein BDN70DRAFT_95523 [Pholiota conissans]|uniref:Uncharacterized protein n=1 Tax=Pholiota conissans TaxID=109636 RepID=A0A9P6CS21_9AGAR|nr:hypothetical protein BDN70DRAFT_95523 [Pholiota conissans]